MQTVRTLYDAVQLVLVFVLLPPQSQQLEDLLLGSAGLLQPLQALTIHLPAGKTLQQPLQGHRGQSQRGEWLIDCLLTKDHIWNESWEKDRGADRESWLKNIFINIVTTHNKNMIMLIRISWEETCWNERVQLLDVYGLKQEEITHCFLLQIKSWMHEK